MTPPISAFLPGEEEQQIERYRRMSPGEKFEEIATLNRLRYERQRAEIRAEYGEVSPEEMRIRLGILRLGREVMAKVLGSQSNLPPHAIRRLLS